MWARSPDLTLYRTMRGAINARTRRGTGEEHRNGGEGRGGGGESKATKRGGEQRERENRNQEDDNTGKPEREEAQVVHLHASAIERTSKGEAHLKEMDVNTRS